MYALHLNATYKDSRKKIQENTLEENLLKKDATQKLYKLIHVKCP